jgi:hypothetical protein
VQTDIGHLFLSSALAAGLRQEERRRKLRTALAAVYEATPGDPRFCVRRLEVVQHAAQTLGIRVLNNSFFAEVEAAARTLGFEAVKNGNRGLFRCAKRKELDEETALAVSRANRRDARWPRAGEELGVDMARLGTDSLI